MKSSNPNTVPVGQLLTNVTTTANTVIQMIAPSSNINGLIIRSLNIGLAGGSSGSGINVFADTSTPSSVTDFTKRVIFQVSCGANTQNSAAQPYPLFLYPGMGVWAGSNSSSAQLFITYDLVNPE